jgi:hypothetical protein
MKMRVSVAAIVVAGSALGCASLTPEGAKVKVYEADAKTPPDARRLPAGCRVLATTAPVDQMESERQSGDPYRVQRNETAAKGGNVLLVLSERTLTLNKTDCAPSDTSPDCQSRAQNWYKVAFESYACDEPGLQALATLQPTSTGVASWWPFGKKPAAPPAGPSASAPASAASAPASAAAPASASTSGVRSSELKAKILVLIREGVGTDVLVAYARSSRLSAPLTAEEIVDWKKSGIADSVIEAALAPFASAR